MPWPRRFVDPEPVLFEALEDRLSALDDAYPEPRSRQDLRRVRRATARIRWEYTVGRVTASWFNGPRP